MLVGIDDLDLVGRLDVGCGDRTLLVDGEEEVPRFVVVGLKLDLLEVEDDFNDILHDAGKAGELMRGSLDADRGDGCPLKRGEERAAEGVSYGVAVSGLKGLGDELGVGFCGGFLVLDEGLRHFEATEADGHGVVGVVAGFPLARCGG